MPHDAIENANHVLLLLLLHGNHVLLLLLLHSQLLLHSSHQGCNVGSTELRRVGRRGWLRLLLLLGVHLLLLQKERVLLM